MRCSGVNRMARVVERNYSIKRNKSELLFNAPNYPMHFVKKDADGLEKESKSQERREISCDKLERKKPANWLKRKQMC